MSCDDCDVDVSASLVPNGPNVAYDFSAWSIFRQASGRISGGRWSAGPRPDPNCASDPDCVPYYGPDHVAMRLTDEERYNNARWLLRLQVGRAFSQDYVPNEWQDNEMGAIVDFLALQDPSDCPDYLNKPQQQAARRAVQSVFFPQPGKHRSVLMKRGPVLVDGEERELMLFTNGFLLCDVELDAFVNSLLDVSPRRDMGHVKRRSEKQLKSRFSDINVDQSGALDRGEVKEFFVSINMPLSEENLSALINKFNENKDGQISFEEFRSTMDHLQDKQGTGSFWGGIGKAARRSLARRGVTRKLDAAFRICDIEKIKREGEGSSISFVAYLNDGGNALKISCSKSGHVDAWLEAFCICICHGQAGDDGAADNVADVGYNFSVWDSFRRGMTFEKQWAPGQSSQCLLGRSQRNSTGGINCNKAEEKKDKINSDHLEGMGGTSDRDHPENEDPLQLTEEERFENARWSMRLQVDEVFNTKYEPLPYEMKEMESILGFLKLEDPGDQSDPTHDPKQQKTEEAIGSIFFPRVGDLRATLLKRGPVLEDGEERELMLFTNGFLLSDVQLNDLVNVLLNAGLGRILDQSEKQVERRFSSIDAYDSRSLDRDEVQGFLRGLGITVDGTVLDKLMDMFDINSDGSISLQEFKLIVKWLKNKTPNSQRGSFWGSLCEGLKGELVKQGISRKLHVAYQISDIEAVERVNDDGIDPELAILALAARVKDVEEPLVISFSKPGHLEAWLEAFNVCIGREADAARIRKEQNLRLVRRSWQKSTLDWEDGDINFDWS